MTAEPDTPIRLPLKFFQRHTREAWARQLLEFATVTKPGGKGPFPLVIQLHGCGGPRPIQPLYGETALAEGFAVMNVDSFKPRRIAKFDAAMRVCTGMLLHGYERAADVYALYDWARRQDWVDKDRIVFAGWSHGGWTVMDALAMSDPGMGDKAGRLSKLIDLPDQPLAGLAAAILIYPYAAFPSMTYSRGWGCNKPKVYAILCGKDQVVGVRHPPRALDRLERDGLTVQRLFLPDATHAFDDETPGDPRSRHHPEYFSQARTWYGRALAEIKAGN